MTTSLWIKRPRPLPDARARLICVPHGGGGPSSFARWIPELAPDIEVCLVHLPGRESRLRDQPLDDMHLIAQRVAEALGPVLDRPFAFLGHSMGAVIAYETAQLLPIAPNHLFASASSAPHHLEEEPPVSHLPDEEFLAEVRRAYDGIPEAVWQDADLMRLMLPSIRADFAAYENYRWRHPGRLACPITAMGGDADPLVPVDSLTRWAELTSVEARVQVFPGGHFYLADERAAVQRLIRESLGLVASDSAA
ncbi:thioesterase II family protein [Streptomyces sp. NPDC127079]|uniref:thioesterase II family protein n=1 Tax=Streptomyces sp. NPDC127079 TaxID=3347132 RepID=UPI003653BD90